MKVFGVNIIEPPLFGPYSIHVVPRGKYEKGKFFWAMMLLDTYIYIRMYLGK